jgi:4-azaleucine resistance transporter AzlC
VLTVRSEIRSALIDIAPPALAAVPIGFLFGAIAVSKGLSPADVALMSAAVFAGSAQFSAMEQWASPAPILTLAIGTLLINCRHILMGASLTPKTQLFSPAQRFLGFFFMADENWAMSERRAAQTALTPLYFFSMAIFFYLNWLVWSTAGSIVGKLLGDPARYGADFAFTALFIGLIAGFWQGRTTAATILTSGVVAALVYLKVGAPWHVPCGALAGIAAAFLVGEPGTSKLDVKDAVDVV